MLKMHSAWLCVCVVIGVKTSFVGLQEKLEVKNPTGLQNENVTRRGPNTSDTTTKIQEPDINQISAPLHVAGRKNDTKAVKAILLNNSKLFDYNKDNSTILHIAVSVENKEMVEDILVSSKEGVNLPNKYGKTAVLMAAERNNSDLFKYILNVGGNPYSKDANGSTALHEAVRQRNMIIIDNILQNNREGLDLQNIDGQTPLHIAAAKGYIDVIKQLLNYGANPNIAEGRTYVNIETLKINSEEAFGNTPLHLATLNNSTMAAAVLLEAGADPYIPNLFRSTSLHLAARVINFEIAESILNKTKDGIDMKDKIGYTALFVSMLKKAYKIFYLLLNFGADPYVQDRSGSTPLSYAGLSGNTYVAELILNRTSKGINMPETGGYTALHNAALTGRYETFKLLLNRGALLNMTCGNSQTALHISSKNGHLEIVKHIINMKKFDLNTRDGDGNTPLHLSVIANNTLMVEALLNGGADPRILNGYTQSSLHLAAEVNNKMIIVEIVKSKRVTIDLQTVEGSTALHFCCPMDLYNSAETLVELGANRSIPDIYGYIPLHTCARYGGWETARILLNGTNYVNLQDYQGMTAMMLAVFFDKVNMAKSLLMAGADPNVVNTAGRSVMHLVASRGMTGLLQLLLRKSVKIDLQDSLGETPLLDALRYRKRVSAMHLLNSNADVTISNKLNNNVLHYLSYQQYNAKLIDKIFDQICNSSRSNSFMRLLNQRNSFGFTPLTFAAYYVGNVDNGNYFFNLLKRGANVSNIDFAGQSLLSHAAIGGNVKILKYLLDVFSINATSYDNMTPIMMAVMGRKEKIYEVYKLLISKNADLKIITKTGRTILHYAAIGGSAQTIDAILNITSDHIHVADFEGYTPLLLAVKYKRYNASLLLLRKGADPNAQNSDGENSILLAAKFANLAMLRLFDHIQYEADGALGVALERRRGRVSEEIIQHLLKRSSIAKDPQFYEAATGDYRLLFEIIDHTHKYFKLKWRRKRFGGIMRQLYKGYIDSLSEVISSDDNILLFNEYLSLIDVSLLFFGDKGFLKDLSNCLNRDLRSECTSQNWSILDYAILRNDKELLEFLLTICGDKLSQMANQFGWTPVHMAAWVDNTYAIIRLKHYGADLAKTDLFNRTPLHVAAMRGNYKIIKTLLHYDNIKNSVDVLGFSPLHLVIIYNSRVLFSRLATAKSDMPASVKLTYRNPHLLEEIAGDRRYQSVLTLVSMKVNLNIQDKMGWTPLHWAAQLGDLRSGIYLVSFGASVNVPSREDETPMRITRRWGHTAFYQFLKSKNGVW